MKKTLMMVVILMATWAQAVKYTSFGLEGAIAGENVVFDLTLGIEEVAKDDVVELVSGNVTVKESKIPNGWELIRRGETYSIKRSSGGWFGGRSSGTVKMSFAARVEPSGEWRGCNFTLPVLPVRSASVVADGAFDVRFTDAVTQEVTQNAEGKTVTVANLIATPRFGIIWKPDVRQVESELVATCDISTVASASPGALRVDTVLTYNIAQGQMTELEIKNEELGMKEE